MASTKGPVTEGRQWERHRRGRHAVLLCPGRWMQNPAERCPFTVIIADPGHDTAEASGQESAEKHWTEIHGGMWGEAQLSRVAGVVDLAELKDRAAG